MIVDKGECMAIALRLAWRRAITLSLICAGLGVGSCCYYNSYFIIKIITKFITFIFIKHLKKKINKQKSNLNIKKKSITKTI
jgi:hypothetical protein